MQAILFRNNKAIGRLVSPELMTASTPVGEHGSLPTVSTACQADGCTAASSAAPALEDLRACEDAACACPLETLQLVFGRWQPARKLQQPPPGVSDLRIPVNDVFLESDFRIQARTRPVVSVC